MPRHSSSPLPIELFAGLQSLMHVSVYSCFQLCLSHLSLHLPVNASLFWLSAYWVYILLVCLFDCLYFNSVYVNVTASLFVSDVTCV